MQNTLHDHPNLPIDPERIFVKLKLADAQAIARYLEARPLGEVVDIYAPIVQGIRQGFDDGQKTAVEALGKMAIDAEDNRRGKEICDEDDRLMAEEGKEMRSVTDSRDTG
jgi:hypothetical protein